MHQTSDSDGQGADLLPRRPGMRGTSGHGAMTSSQAKRPRTKFSLADIAKAHVGTEPEHPDKRVVISPMVDLKTAAGGGDYPPRELVAEQDSDSMGAMSPVMSPAMSPVVPVILDERTAEGIPVGVAAAGKDVPLRMCYGLASPAFRVLLLPLKLPLYY